MGGFFSAVPEICSNSINAEYAGFVGIKGSVVSYWNYIPQDGTFRFERDDSEVSLILTKNIEGTWKDERMSTSRNPYYFIITDQGEDHFTIEYTYEDIKDTVYISTENLSDFEESYERLAFSKKASLEYKVDIEIYESGAGQYTLQYRTNFAGHNYNYNTWAYITN